MSYVRQMIIDEFCDSEFLFMDGFDDCVVGVAERFGCDPVIAYDIDKVINKHVMDGMTEEEAYEFFAHNQIGAWAGERTPVFITLI